MPPMAQALRLMDDDDTVLLDPEAKYRIDQVRLRQLSFQVKKHYPDLVESDAEALAAALMEVFDQGKDPIADEIRSRLIGHGHSDADADRLVTAIGLRS